jgi:SagB-type dehydrogenase family enzyme
MDPLDTVLHYHQTTKHRPNQYARSTGHLDWANQPDPFRRHAGAPCVRLPLRAPETSGSPTYDALFEPGAIVPQPVTLATISEYFQYSLAVSAWKQYQGTRWALRINPSSGNLHPTEGYLAIGVAPSLTDVPAVFHYAPKDHVLECRRTLHLEEWDQLLDGFPKGTFLTGLASIHWREAWKYGERAYRYCQHDMGHALAALALSAALQGWQVRPLTALGDDELQALVGLDRPDDAGGAEPEHPGLVVAVITSPHRELDRLPASLPSDAIRAVRKGAWLGQPNRLSSDHVAWDIIDAVNEACAKPRTPEAQSPVDAWISANCLEHVRRSVPARRIIQQRRSAVAMDGRTRLSADQFYRMMDRVLPRYDRAPWCALGCAPHVHLGLMVHRVDGLEPGLYVLVRSPGQLSELQNHMHGDFAWTRPAGCPEALPLYHLLAGDARAVAGQVSCGQSIAADGAFSLAMFAEFAGPLAAQGPWLYRHLFWETGAIGQVLYLEAEAAGVRSTGIGCFFDDLVHELFGLKDRTWQSLYHFTVGGPVEDTRLTTLPPYPPGRTQD